MPQEQEGSILLHRIDERTMLLVDKFSELKREMDQMQHKQFKAFVTREEFAPVKSIVYGIVTAMMVGVMTALGALVLRMP